MTTTPQVPPGVDPNVASPARLYDYYLGGSTNFEVDRVMGERLRAALPDLYDGAWANRGFHQRAACWMAARGIRQFIDIGSGLPTQGNTHQAVRKVRPDARVIYVDIDPMVLSFADQLLAGADGTKVITADMRDPDAVLNNPDLRGLIDLGEPAGLLMTAVLHFVADGSNPRGLVARYANALAPGSYVALSHATADKLPAHSVEAIYATYEHATEKIYLRPRAEFERFFDGLDLVEPYEGAAPGITYVGRWGAEDPEAADSDGSRILYCGVGRRR